MSADFLDTNVLVYLFDDEDERKHRVARATVTRAMDEGSGVISHQVVQETLNVLSRGLRRSAEPSDLRAALEELLAPLWQVMPTVPLYRRGLDVRERYGFSFYDSLIVAAAVEAGCDRLLSEDLQHGQRIEGVLIEDPFRA